MNSYGFPLLQRKEVGSPMSHTQNYTETVWTLPHLDVFIRTKRTRLGACFPVSVCLHVSLSAFLFSSDSTPSCQLGSISLHLSLKIQIIFSWICRQNYFCKFFVFSSLFWNYIIKSLLRKTQPWSNGKRKHHEVTAPSKTTLWVCGWGAR